MRGGTDATDLVMLEEFEDGEDNVVNIAEARGLALFGMVKAASPVDGDVTESMVKLDGPTHGSPGIGLTEVEKAIKNRAILADVEALESPDLVLLRLWGDAAKEGHIVVGMEATQVAVSGGAGLEHLHVLKQAVVSEKCMGHADPVGFHWVPLTVIVVPHLRIVEIVDLSFGPLAAARRRQRVSPSLHVDASFPRPPPNPHPKKPSTSTKNL